MGHLRHYTVRTAYSHRVQYRAFRALLSSLTVFLVALILFALVRV